EFDGWAKWRKRDVLKLDVALCLVMLGRSVGRYQAVPDLTATVNQEDVVHPPRVLVEDRFAQVSAHVSQVFLSVNTADSQSHTRHNRLFLLDYHVGISPH